MISLRDQISSFHPATARNTAQVHLSIEAAHKKGSGSTKNGRDSVSKRRGVKVFGNQPVLAGGIIIRQVGNKIHPGMNVGCGKDYTIFALTAGLVKFERIRGRNCVSVYPNSEAPILSGHKTPTRRERRLSLYTSRKTTAD